MGAAEFRTLGKGTDANDAFYKVREAAAWEHGHGGYTGTIAEKDEFLMRSEKVMTYNEADVFAQADLENNDKWGPAFALRVVDVDPQGEKFDGYMFYGWASQ